MSYGKRLGIALVLMASLSCAAWPALSAHQQPKQKSKVDVGSFMVKELFQIKLDGDRTQMAIWVPFEFMIESAIAAGVEREAAERELVFLKDYQIVLVQCGTQPIFGAPDFASLKDVRARTVLKLANGEQVKPLEKIPDNVAQLVNEIKRIAASDGGTSGANIHALLFPNSYQGKPIIDTSKQQKLTLLLKADTNFKEAVMVWHTPFDALTPVPPCPACKETVSAKWAFCPWCGAKLVKK